MGSILMSVAAALLAMTIASGCLEDGPPASRCIGEGPLPGKSSLYGFTGALETQEPIAGVRLHFYTTDPHGRLDENVSSDTLGCYQVFLQTTPDDKSKCIAGCFHSWAVDVKRSGYDWPEKRVNSVYVLGDADGIYEKDIWLKATSESASTA